MTDIKMLWKYGKGGTNSNRRNATNLLEEVGFKLTTEKKVRIQEVRVQWNEFYVLGKTFKMLKSRQLVCFA